MKSDDYFAAHEDWQAALESASPTAVVDVPAREVASSVMATPSTQASLSQTAAAVQPVASSLSTWLFSGLMLLLAVPLLGYGFLAASVEPQSTATSKTVLVTRPIGEYRVGQRVVGRNPDRPEVDESIPEVHPKTWRHLKLWMLKENGKRLDVGLLRDESWLLNAEPEAGGALFLTLPEFGASGDAFIQSDVRRVAAAEKIPLGALSKKHKEPRPATAYPTSDPSKSGATTWIKYPADDVLLHGIGIGVCDGVIVGVVSEDPKQPDYELMCTRYVVHDLDKSDITMPLWRKFDLRMPKHDGSVSEISVLRPLWWIEETGVKEGGTIDLGLLEIGVSGQASVIKIGPCEVDSRDCEKGYQIVTGAIKHDNAELWDLIFNNDSTESLGVTDNHPIFSNDRNDWVPAGELRMNERVRTIDGTATLTGKSTHFGRETVYNLEVHRSHAYHVSQLGVLAHNSNILDCTKTVIYRGKESPELLRHARAGIDMKLDKQTKLLIPEKTGLSVNVDQQKVLSIRNKDGTPKFPTAPRVKSIPDELQIIQQGTDLGHYGISPKTPMTPERFQELLNLVEFFD